MSPYTIVTAQDRGRIRRTPQRMVRSDGPAFSSTTGGGPVLAAVNGDLSEISFVCGDGQLPNRGLGIVSRWRSRVPGDLPAGRTRLGVGQRVPRPRGGHTQPRDALYIEVAEAHAATI